MSKFPSEINKTAEMSTFNHRRHIIAANVEAMATTNAESPMRCREVSVAITHLETGLLWLEEAARVLAQVSVEGKEGE